LRREAVYPDRRMEDRVRIPLSIQDGAPANQWAQSSRGFEISFHNIRKEPWSHHSVQAEVFCRQDILHSMFKFF
jgi:hypothetical protein